MFFEGVYLRYRQASVFDIVNSARQAKAMHGDGVLSKPIVFVAFTKLYQVHMLKRANGKANVLHRDRCSAYE